MNHWRRPKKAAKKTAKKARRLPARAAVHVLRDSGVQDQLGRKICTCGALEGGRIHNKEDPDDETREIAARIIGEGGKT